MPILAIERLTLNFGGISSLRDVSLEIAEHSLFGLIGPNGAGKTSLFNCLTGFYRATSGTVRLRGVDITRASPASVAAFGVRRTFQNIRIFSKLSTLENVLVGAHLRSSTNLLAGLVGTPGYRRRERELVDEARSWLDFVGLGNHARIRAADLPYGLRKLAEIARGLMGAPTVLLLDEPAAGLSSPERLELIKVIKRIRDRGITVVMIEHDVELVMQMVDEVAVLDHGTLIARGLPNAVRSDPLVAQAYLGKRRR